MYAFILTETLINQFLFLQKGVFFTGNGSFYTNSSKSSSFIKKKIEKKEDTVEATALCVLHTAC